MNPRLVVFCCLVFISVMRSQVRENADSVDSEDLDLESVLESETEDAADSQRFTVIAELLEHPLDLNEASEGELGEVPGLHQIVIARILERRSARLFRSISELKEIRGVSAPLLRRLRRFLKIGRPETAHIDVRSRLVSATRPSKAFQQNIYMGSPVKEYDRLRVQLPVQFAGGRAFKVVSGLVTEKDPGEHFGDFVSGYVETDAPEYRVLIGDYMIESGMGLMFPRKYGTSSGADVFGPGRYTTRIDGYSSTEENFFFRGAFVESLAKKSIVGLFVSRKPLNGTIDEAGLLVSIDQSGLFRTASEHRKKGSAQMSVVGGFFTFAEPSRWNGGLKFFLSELDHQPVLSGNALPGRTGALGGDVRVLGSGWSLFGEIAGNASGIVAAEAAVEVEPSETMELLIVGRTHPSSFENVFRVSFDSQDDQSLYAGCSIGVSPRLRLKSSVGVGYEGWDNSVSVFPNASERMYAGIEWNITAQTGILVEYKSKETTIRSTNGQSTADSRRQENLRFSLMSDFSGGLRSQTRIETGLVSHGFESHQHGLLLLEDLDWKPGPFRVSCRLVFFDTDSYDSRLYEFENDLRGTFATPALYGKGIRSYALVEWKVSNVLVLGAKYSATFIDGARVLGSGIDEVRGDVAGSIGVQADLRF